MACSGRMTLTVRSRTHISGNGIENGTDNVCVSPKRVTSSCTACFRGLGFKGIHDANTSPG
jgi:hypothetical protein